MDEYIKATFKGCWKGVQQKWILVDMRDQPPWVNKLLFSLAIKNKRLEPPMTDHLAALTKCVAELCLAGLEVCHCIEEFYLRWIRPHGNRKNWRSNVREWPIPTANLRKFVSLSFLCIIDNSLV